LQGHLTVSDFVISSIFIFILFSSILVLIGLPVSHFILLLHSHRMLYMQLSDSCIMLCTHL
jgi:hypothetical protein